MVKRIIILLISLASLVGLAYYLPRTSPPAGQVKGKLINGTEVGALTSVWERPLISDRTGQWKIFFINDSRADVVSTIPGDPPQLLPAEISNGRWLYFTQENGFFKLWRYTAGDPASQFVLALRRQPTSLTAARDGRLAVYTLSDSAVTADSRRTFLVTVDTGEMKEIIAGARSLSFSSDSRRIVYNTKTGLFTAEVARDLTIGEALTVVSGDIHAPVYSADGESVFFIQKKSGEYFLNRAELRTGITQTILPLGVNTGITDWSLELSPDGKKLVYCGTVGDSYIQTVIGRTLIDGSGWKILSQEGGEAHWSKSGQAILFNLLEFTPDGPRLQVWRMDEEGNNREAVAREGNNWFSQVPQSI